MNYKLLPPLEDRMYLYFFGKNINNIKFKYNTKKMIVLNRLPYQQYQRGMDFRLWKKISTRKKKFKIYLNKFQEKFCEDLWFSQLQKFKFVNKIFNSIRKEPNAFHLFYKIKKVLTLEKVKEIKTTKDNFVVVWYSQKAALKNLLLKLDYKFPQYLEFKTVFVTTVEFQYWYKELDVNIYFKWNRVNIYICLPKKCKKTKYTYANFKKELSFLKNMYIQRSIKLTEDEEYERSVYWYKESWLQPENLMRDVLVLQYEQQLQKAAEKKAKLRERLRNSPYTLADYYRWRSEIPEQDRIRRERIALLEKQERDNYALFEEMKNATTCLIEGLLE